MTRTLRFGRYAFESGNEDKVLFPDDGIRKGQLVEYYRRVAEYAVPHLRDRPLTLRRFPDGIAEQGFFQQQASAHFPDWVRRVRVAKRGGGALARVVCDNAATLAYLATQACIELHAWTSRVPALDAPDQMVFDLDPSGDDFEPVRAGARALRALLEDVGLVVFLKTSGSRGLHLVVPLDGSADFDAVRGFAREVAECVAGEDPDRFTTEQRLAKRRGRLFLDTGRNAWGQTVVAPYSVRARPGAPVSTPLSWDELGDGRLRADRFTVRNLFRRLARVEEPWRGMARRARALAEPRRKLAARLEAAP